MGEPKIRRLDGRFDDPEIETAFMRDSWAGIRVQAALTLIGFSLAWIVSTATDLMYMQDSPYFLPTLSARLLSGSVGLLGGAWVLMARPGYDSRALPLIVYGWILISTLTAVIVASVFPTAEATPDGVADVLVFTSSWMSLHVLAIGVALAAFPWGIAFMSMAYMITYLILAVVWNDQSEHPMIAQSVVVVACCFFAWLMAITFSMRARRRFYITRLYEQAKIAAEKAQEFSSFLLAATGHDIRQPIYALDLNASMLEELVDAEQWDKVKPLVQRQKLVASNVASMLSSVLELSYLDNAKRPVTPTPCDAGRLLRDSVSGLKDVALSRGMALHCEPCSARIQVDSGVAGHILSNLISNAITHSKGSRLLVGARRAGQFIDLVVADNGAGMGDRDLFLESRSALARINGGQPLRSGMGMEIMFRLAERGDLALRITSRPGHGVMACLRCPRV